MLLRKLYSLRLPPISNNNNNLFITVTIIIIDQSKSENKLQICDTVSPDILVTKEKYS